MGSWIRQIVTKWLPALALCGAAAHADEPKFDLKGATARFGTAFTVQYGTRAVAFSADGRCLVAATSAYDPDPKGAFNLGLTVRVWELATAKELRRVWINGGGNSGSVIVSANRVAALIDGGVRLWDLTSGKELAFFAIPNSPIYCFAPSPDESTVVVARGGTLTWWDVKTARPIRTAFSRTFSIGAVAFSPDGRWLATGSDHEIALWSADGLALRRIHAYCGARSLVFSPDGRTLASIGTDMTTRLWDVESGGERIRFNNAMMSDNQIAFPCRGRLLAVAGSGRTLQFFNALTGETVAQRAGSGGGIRQLAVSPDGNLLAGGVSDGSVLTWDTSAMIRAPQTKELSDAELRMLWNDLQSDAADAWRAMRRLSDSPAGAVRVGRTVLRPAGPRPTFDIPAAIRDLGAERFADRDRASRKLRDALEDAAPLLAKALADDPSPEKRRRVELLLQTYTERVPSPVELQTLRGVELLERLDTPESRRFREELAKGDSAARLTQEAKASLERVSR